VGSGRRHGVLLTCNVGVAATRSSSSTASTAATTPSSRLATEAETAGWYTSEAGTPMAGVGKLLE
ncbi:MAG: hypothetical protein LC808_12815, partial [Actinobacteria bacterium]|nr:hypothetical protein [Actinomycetota bacterium]